MKTVLLSIACFLATLAGSFVEPGESPTQDPNNTQPETIPLLTPQQACDRIRMPDGFQVSLFAAEPDVQQPIAMAFDARGRLWVAENYTYAEAAINYDLSRHDRIVIFEDTDGDGRADERTVFWDQAQRLTSIELGFGGVWALCPPHLLFIPDRDGDDRPDGEPQVMLDGWDDNAARHNFVNGLRWGPDGWLYGRNGITATSFVATPGTPQTQRVPINCAIWRFHPQRHTFEVVCSGTTNPWGMDWDANGQLFFINTVIGHLWHALPGAHFRRMFGEDLNPYVYELIEQTADHFHWDTAAEDWRAIRAKGVSESTSRAGGGHAHCGTMIYLGDNWPVQYRGDLFTLNLHGRRMNRDHIERHGASYVGRHRPDLLTTSDEWFRGIDLGYGPDGGVYILDWADIGECHENDGVHRTSGRIYKVFWRGEGQRHSQPRLPHQDLTRLSNMELVELQSQRNEWFVRQARRVLQERASGGEDLNQARTALWARCAKDSDLLLRALWCLHATGGIETERLLELLGHDNEHVRVWAIRLLVDSEQVSPAAIEALEARSQRETSGLVLTYLASALQRLPLERRFRIADALVGQERFAADRVLPLMTWYGIEPAVVRFPHESLRLLEQCRMPRVTQATARRLTSELATMPAGADGLVALMRQPDHAAIRLPILMGMSDALRGWCKAAPPQGWSELVAELGQSSDQQLSALARDLSVVFGDGRAIEDVRRLASDRQQPISSRRQAIRTLVAARVPELGDLLKGLLADQDVADEAIRALATTDLGLVAPVLVGQYSRMGRAGKLAAVEVLASRPDAAARLLDAVEHDAVPRADVSPFLLRQLQLLPDPVLAQRVAQLWPETRLIAEDKLKLIARYRQQLDNSLKEQPDLEHGRKLFENICGKCHKLFGQGASIGPELTGAQRSNLNYWLENIIDPSAVVPMNFRMSILALNDGRVLNGVLSEPTQRTIALQTPTDKIVLERSAIAEIRTSELSLMPDGQLSPLSDTEVRDLFAYLMKE